MELCWLVSTTARHVHVHVSRQACRPALAAALAATLAAALDAALDAISSGPCAAGFARRLPLSVRTWPRRESSSTPQASWLPRPT
eukprot:358162-Chlamydomonas_euryale.AAC.8